MLLKLRRKLELNSIGTKICGGVLQGTEYSVKPFQQLLSNLVYTLKIMVLLIHFDPAYK